MNYIDFIIIAIVIISFLLGYKDGFFRKLIGTVGFFMAVYIGFSFAESAGKLVQSVTDFEPYFARVVGGFLLFLIIYIITSVGAHLVHPFDKMGNVVNQIVGGIVGVIQFLFFLSAIFYVLRVFNFPSESVRTGSLFYNKVYGIIVETIDFLDKNSPEAQEFLRKNILEKDSIPKDSLQLKDSIPDKRYTK